MPRQPPADPNALSGQELDEALSDMERVLAAQPQLGDFGFGVFDPRRKSPAQLVETLAKERDDICSPSSLAAFVRTCQWLRQFDKRKTLNKTAGSSYALKHVAEQDIGYITNGVFIAAAIAEGFDVVRINDSPNAWLNISIMEPQHD